VSDVSIPFKNRLANYKERTGFVCKRPPMYHEASPVAPSRRNQMFLSPLK